jgi:hypothetical protein
VFVKSALRENLLLPVIRHVSLVQKGTISSTRTALHVMPVKRANTKRLKAKKDALTARSASRRVVALVRLRTRAEALRRAIFAQLGNTTFLLVWQNLAMQQEPIAFLAPLERRGGSKMGSSNLHVLTAGSIISKLSMARLNAMSALSENSQTK